MLLTISSGLVSLLLTRDIKALRSAVVSLSIGGSLLKHYSRPAFGGTVLKIGRSRSIFPVTVGRGAGLAHLSEERCEVIHVDVLSASPGIARPTLPRNGVVGNQYR